MTSPTVATLRLHKMVHGGAALARLPDSAGAAAGRVALVRGGIPGELVDAELEERAGVLQGRVVRVHEPSTDRQPTPRHPGLDYGHIAYERQLALKREVLADALTRAGGAAADAARELPPVRPSPREWGYRSAVQPAVHARGLGYRAPGSHEVVVLDEDPTANAALQRAWAGWLELVADAGGPPKGVRELALRGNERGEALAALVATSPQRELLDFAHRLVAAGVHGVSYAPYDPRGRFRAGRERLAGARAMLQRYGEVEITVAVGAFAQPNPEAAGELYRALAALAPGGAHALDLYAGSGAIGMHLAPRYHHVTCLEIDRGSVTRGRRDAERLGLANVRFEKADARRAEIPAGVDLVALDPPRAGLSKELRRTLVASGVGAIVYVSCDAATWARDVAALVAGGFGLAHVEPFDFQPHTHHLEVLSLLER